MFITDLKINGLTNPMGFSLSKVNCSWKVEDTVARRQKKVLIEVSLTEDFTCIVYTKKGVNLSSLCTPLEFQLYPRTRYYWRISLKGNKKEAAVSPTAWFETDKMHEPWQANWIACQEKDTFHPEFLKDFYLDQEITKARLYITGLGLYQAYINGKRCGLEYLTPNFTDYFSGVEYQTYDVTDLIKKENVISIHTGKGWYMGTLGKEQKTCLYGSEMCCLAELHLYMEDGTEEILSTDESWFYNKSFIQESDFVLGEEYNRNIKKPAKNKKVCLVEAPFQVKQRTSLPVTENETLSPKQITKAEKNSYIVDFGTKITGFIEFNAKAKSGTKILIEYGNLTKDGKFAKLTEEKGSSSFSFTSDGSGETVHPLFTCYTYTAVKVTGWPEEPTKKDIRSVSLYAEMERTGWISTSSKEINELYEKAVQDLKASSVAIPNQFFNGTGLVSETRSAWIQATHSAYTLNSFTFYKKYLEYITNEQARLAGAIPSFLPSLAAQTNIASGWADAAILLPSLLNQTYCSEQTLKNFYPSMKAWIEYLKKTDGKAGNSHLLSLENQQGDTLAKDGLTPNSKKGSTEELFIATVFYYQSALIVAHAAQKLGREWDALSLMKLAFSIRQRIYNEWFTPSGRLALDTQTAYILCLNFGIYSSKEKLVNQFKTRLSRDLYQLKCGLVGLPYALDVLSENGMENLAYQNLSDPESPVWLNAPHSAARFLYSRTGGITPLEKGYKKAEIAPCINMKLREYTLSFNSPQGKYVVEWNIRDDGMILLHLEIPFNAKAKVMLPKCNGKNVEKIKGNSKIKFNSKGIAVFKSGEYDILYKPTDDFRYIYSPETRIIELTGDKEAMKLLQKNLPEIYDGAINNDVETLNKSLGEIQSFLKPDMDDSDADATLSQIQSLIRW